MNPNASLDTAALSDAERRILKAAGEEFAEKGFFGARTQSIADAAGVNKAMLHYYFRSKDRLYQQVIILTFKGLLTRVMFSWSTAGSLSERLAKLVDNYLDTFARNPQFLKIIMREVVDGGERLKKSLREFRSWRDDDQGFKPMDVIRRAGSELGMAPEETIHYIMNVVGMCVVSFISPIIVENVIDFDLPDMDQYMSQRRKAIKAMVQAYIDSRAGKERGLT